MIISRTPLRISFFGGGTDLRSYYSKRPGRVISAGIDKYLYVVLREQVGFVEHRYRINWSQESPTKPDSRSLSVPTPADLRGTDHQPTGVKLHQVHLEDHAPYMLFYS